MESLCTELARGTHAGMMGCFPVVTQTWWSFHVNMESTYNNKQKTRARSIHVLHNFSILNVFKVCFHHLRDESDSKIHHSCFFFFFFFFFKKKEMKFIMAVLFLHHPRASQRHENSNVIIILWIDNTNYFMDR